jgi:hypothetical protein
MSAEEKKRASAERKCYLGSAVVITMQHPIQPDLKISHIIINLKRDFNQTK